MQIDMQHPRDEVDERSESLLLEHFAGDWMRVMLLHLHPKEGLHVTCLCKTVRACLGSLDEMWEMWALAFWPKNTVVPAVPRLYPNFEALVRDDNRRGAMRVIRWPDHVGRSQQASSWSQNTPGRFYSCRVLALEHNQHEGLLSVHFDVRGEADLLPPCGAKLWLGRAEDPRDDRRSCWAETRPKAHALRHVNSGRAVFSVATTSSGEEEVHEWGTPVRGFSGSGGVGRRCTGHITFCEESLSYAATCLRAKSRGGIHDHLQLNFTYASHMDVPPLNYNRATLAEWPVLEKLSLGEVLAKYRIRGGEVGFCPAGGVPASLALPEGKDTAEYAKTKRFSFAPDPIKKRTQWWV